MKSRPNFLRSKGSWASEAMFDADRHRRTRHPRVTLNLHMLQTQTDFQKRAPSLDLASDPESSTSDIFRNRNRNSRSTDPRKTPRTSSSPPPSPSKPKPSMAIAIGDLQAPILLKCSVCKLNWTNTPSVYKEQGPYLPHVNPFRRAYPRQSHQIFS